MCWDGSGKTNRWNSACKRQALSYFVTIFRRMTISPTNSTWRAMESRTNTESKERTCPSAAVQDDAPWIALYFYPGAKCVCAVHHFGTLSCLKGPCPEGASLSPHYTAEENTGKCRKSLHSTCSPPLKPRFSWTSKSLSSTCMYITFTCALTVCKKSTHQSLLLTNLPRCRFVLR